MKNKKTVIIISMVVVAIAVCIIFIGAIIAKRNSKEVNNLIGDINTNELFTFLDEGVNEELKGTYAF